MIEKLCGAEIKIVPGGLQHRSFIPEEFFFLYLRNKTTCEDSGTGRWFLMERAERSGGKRFLVLLSFYLTLYYG